MSINDLKALQLRAEQGDARAQYQLSYSLVQAGDRQGADRWLKSAATLGEPDASYTLATRNLKTSRGTKDAYGLLKSAAAAGSLAAKRLLAVLYAEGLGVTADWNKAVSLVLEAAKASDPSAMREVATLLLLHDASHADGIGLLKHAASRDAVAAAVFVRWSIEAERDVEQAARALSMLKSARYPNAAHLEAKLSRVSSKANSPAWGKPSDWSRIASDLEDRDRWAAPKGKQLCATPDARVMHQAFSPLACEYIIAVAAQRLAPSTTVDPRTGQSRLDAYRTSLTATIGPVDLDLVLAAINRQIASLAGRPVRNGEFLSVLRYGRAQEYRPHFDWLPEGEDRDRGGQRATTALLYLNHDYQGGETHFLSPDVRFKGEPGDLLVFDNILPDGAPDMNSRHASLPVAGGVKWLCSKWFRCGKYNF